MIWAIVIGFARIVHPTAIYPWRAAISSNGAVIDLSVLVLGCWMGMKVRSL